MAIIRTRQKSRFTTISNLVFSNNNLSFQAMGMLAYLLSKPDNWSVSPSHLAKVTQNTAKKTGRDGVYNILKELRVAGYVEVKKRSSGETDYLVFDEPIEPNTSKAEEVENQHVNDGKDCYSESNNCSNNEPDPLKPDPLKPDPPKTTLINTDNKQILSSNKDPLNPQNGDKTDSSSIISYLNESKEKLASELGQSKPRGARPIKSNLRKISARLKDGFTIDDCKLVIDYLHQRWGHERSMNEYFVLGSVFVASKFEDKLIKAQAWADAGRPEYRHGAFTNNSYQNSSVDSKRNQDALDGLLRNARTLEDMS